MAEQQNVQEQDINQLLKVRREKLAALQEAGKDPFEITKFDQTKYANGTLCNMKFHPTALRGENGWRKLRDVMLTYFKKGGMELQLNIVSSETLRKAQKNPEDYQDLVVRVAGFSAYFVEVYKEAQDALIERTEMSM